MSKKITSLNFSLYVFILFFVMSAVARYTNDFLPAEIAYPGFLRILIDWNREIFGFLLALLVLLAIISRNLQKISVGFYWAPILLHIFLSIKLISYGNSEWYISFFGALSLIGIVFACANANRQLCDMDQFERFCMTLVLVFVAIAAMQYVMSGIENMQYGSRYFFFTAHSNQAGVLWGFCALTLVFLLIYGSLISVMLKLAILLICLFFLFLTESRGAMLSCGAGIAVIVFIGTGSAKKNMNIYLLVLAIFMGLYFLMSNPIDDFYTRMAERGNTRTDLYVDAMDGFLAFPFFGIPYEYGRPTFVENTLLSFMKSAGIVGLLLCVTFYVGSISILRRSFIKLKKSKEPIPRYFFALFVMMLCASIFESYPINFVSTGSFITIFAATYLLQYARR